MPLIPYDTLLIDSPLPVEQAAARLAQATGPRTWVRFGPRSHPFVGEVTGHRVSIERAIGYQNSFLPRIRAHLDPRAEGCRLAGTLSLHPMVGGFMLLWVAANVLMGLWMGLPGLAQGEPRPGIWIVTGMLIFSWVLCSGAFTIEAHVTRKRLATLLDAPGGGR